MILTIKLVFTIALILVGVHGKTSFVKDLSTDMPFPPTKEQTIAGIPVGHLRPLGWQKKPDGKVREEKDMVAPPTFHLRYAKTGRPVVLRGLLKGTDVVEKWEEDAYLKQNFGKVNVTITVKKEIHNHGPQRSMRRMLFKKFLLDYMYENWYLASTVHADMMFELPLPNVLSCGSYKDRLTEAELWMSSGGTSSLLHAHGDHNVHCVLDGRKDFILIDQKHKDVFQFHENFPNSASGHSDMDMDMINAYKHPKIAQTPWTWSTLWQGDCIYIPAGHLHQVRSYGRSISYTVQFAPALEFESTDCKEETKSKRKKKGKKDKDDAEETEEEEIKSLMLSDVDFIWTYSNGERHLKDTKLNPSTLRRIFLVLMRDGKQLHRNQFKHFYEESLTSVADKPPADEIFHIMTPNNSRDYLSREEINALVPSRLQHVCDIFNKRNEKVHDEL